MADASGLGAHELIDPMRLVPLRKVASLFVMASRTVNDCGLALKLAEASSAGNSGLMGHLALAAPTVRAFLECIAGYAPILVMGIEVGFSDDGRTGRLAWRAPSELDVSLKPCSLFFAASIVHRVRAAAGATWVPVAASFEHKAPAISPEELIVFGARTTFDCDETSITFDAATLARPIPTANAHLFAIYRHHASLLLRDAMSELDLTAQVKRAIGERLASQAASLDTVAADLGVSPRHLQRRLEQSGVSFDKVLDDRRRATAERLLRETNRPLMQVALDTGYSSQSTFTRAVRRWLKASPRAYRQQFREASLDSARVTVAGSALRTKG